MAERMKEPPPPRPRHPWPVIYELDPAPDSGTWSAGNADARMSRAADGLIIDSDDSSYHYQLVSSLIEVTPQKKYAAQFDIVLTDGGMTIGVLDAVSNTWIVQHQIEPSGGATREVSFAAPSKAVRLVVANFNPDPGASSALLRRLALLDQPDEAADRTGAVGEATREWYRLIAATSGGTWSKGGAETTATERDSRLEITSGVSRYGYQVVSSLIPVDPGTGYSVSWDVEVNEGGMAIGVLDVAADSWIVQRRLDAKTETVGELSFVAPSDSVRLVVFNDNPEPARSSAWIGRLVLRGPADGDSAARPASTSVDLEERSSVTYHFADRRVIEFSRTNLGAIVAASRAAEATPILAYHWRRDLSLTPARRRALHQARRPGFILSLRHEEMVTTTYDDIVGELADELDIPLIEDPMFEASVPVLADRLAEELTERLKGMKP